MEKTEYIWFDGLFKKWEDSTIHILTHSLHYGSAVFEGIRVYETEKGAAIFRLKEHVERLFNSAKVMKMSISYSKEQIEQAILETVRKNNLKSGYIRPIIFYGDKMGLSVKNAPVHISISCWPWGAYLGENPIKVKISSTIRIHPKSSVMQAKISGHYSNSIIAGEEAREAGFEEALLLDYKGFIAEGPGENFFIIKNQKLITPKTECILQGITRDSIIKIAQDNNIEVIERDISPEETYDADEAFFTGTAAEVTLIDSVDNHQLKNKDKDISKKLKQIYSDTVKGKIKKYDSWLAYVN